MLDGNKNLKDSTTGASLSLKDISFSISYNKTHKLITALYMVTDIIDKEEPIRNKLRTLGTEIISDMHSMPAEARNKIAETMSFLNIASAMNFISEMNCAILKKEFLALKESVQEGIDMKPTWLAGFFDDSHLEGWPKAGVDKVIPPPPKGYSSRGELISKGHKGHTRIGVQKGSTLMQALSDTKLNHTGRDVFEMLKKQRRENILNIIKNNGGNAGIKDILNKINIGEQDILSHSEKTLQRELMSMTKDGVLDKTGKKRWSRYFIKHNPS